MSENFSVRVGQRLIAGRKSDPARKPERGATPLIVALHGGGFTSGYFDAGPYSLLDAASAAGCAAVALDRPGYGSSSPLPEGDRAIPRNAEFLRDAVAEIWRQRADDLTGVVLVGHSIGSLTSLHIAADPGDWPLLGVAVSGLGLGAPPITPFWNDHGPEEWVETPTEYRLGLMFGQPGTYTADGPELSNTAARPVWWRRSSKVTRRGRMKLQASPRECACRCICARVLTTYCGLRGRTKSIVSPEFYPMHRGSTPLSCPPPGTASTST